MTKKSLDLETAQQLYIAAGQPEQARAAGFVIDAVRNTVQGEWGQSFVGSLEKLLITHIAPLVVSQKETQDGVAALSAQFQEDVKALTARLDRKRGEIDEIKRDQAALAHEQSVLAREQVDLAARLARLEAAHGDGA